MQNFLKATDEFPPVKCRVFTNYDQLDALAAKRGYESVECGNDDRIGSGSGVGLQNGSLHSGWIASIGDGERVNVLKQVELLKAKISECLSRKEAIIIGFCQTGHFSVGYSLYVKNQATIQQREAHRATRAKVRANIRQ